MHHCICIGWIRFKWSIRSAQGSNEDSEHAPNRGPNGNPCCPADDSTGGTDRCAADQSDSGAGCYISATIRSRFQPGRFGLLLTDCNIQFRRFASLKLKVCIRPQHRFRPGTGN